MPTLRMQGRGSPVITVGSVRFLIVSGIVELDGRPVELSGRERAVLEILMSRLGVIVSKERIEERIYDWDSSSRVLSNTVEVYISALRRKLGRRFIKTVRGIGYVISP